MVRCPYVYKSGKPCSGHVTMVERYHTTAEWGYDEASGSWSLSVDDRGTHFHLFCSAVSEHNPPVKCWGHELPEELHRVVYPGGE